jgi:hypothetical protein
MKNDPFPIKYEWWINLVSTRISHQICKIKTSLKLFRDWYVKVAEGFCKPVSNKCWERFHKSFPSDGT